MAPGIYQLFGSRSPLVGDSLNIHASDNASPFQAVIGRQFGSCRETGFCEGFRLAKEMGTREHKDLRTPRNTVMRGAAPATAAFAILPKRTEESP